MAGYSIPSASAAPSAASTTQPLRQQSEAAQINRLAADSNASGDTNDTGVRETQRAQATQPTTNTLGQTIGTTINTTA
jgi:hypothetical protein